jgi:GrpB-like predicted nucleotidyltransferase (UPF0157 family)
MPTFDPFATNADRSVPINTPTPVDGQVVLVEYDPAWPAMYEAEAAFVRAALGEAVLLLEHVGSTAVPGLVAKPCIDMLLAVTDSADEDAYVTQLDSTGFVLRMRHPEWNEHRVFKSERINVNLHVWSMGSPEIDRHLVFRDWLRSHPEDRDAYAAAKRRIAAGHIATISDYAAQKDAIVAEITARMLAAGDR